MSENTHLQGPVQAKLTFFDPPRDGSRPFVHIKEPPLDPIKRNFSKVSHQVVLDDIRGSEI